MKRILLSLPYVTLLSFTSFPSNFLQIYRYECSLSERDVTDDIVSDASSGQRRMHLFLCTSCCHSSFQWNRTQSSRCTGISFIEQDHLVHPQLSRSFQIELACAFFHETVPSKCSSAFLSALVTNTSHLPILPASASVYVNNSFVSKVRSILSSSLHCLSFRQCWVESLQEKNSDVLWVLILQ